MSHRLRFAYQVFSVCCCLVYNGLLDVALLLQPAQAAPVLLCRKCAIE